MNCNLNKLIYLSMLILLFLTSINSNLYSQVQLQENMTKKAINGIANVASSIISDSFTPMTHYTPGDFTVTLVPSYFDISRIYDDPELSGQNLKGGAVGFGCGYALNKRVMFYSIFSSLFSTGSIKGEFIESSPSTTVDTKYSLYSFNSGAGFDILESNKWSIPVCAGISIQRYSADLNLPAFTVSPPPGHNRDECLRKWSIIRTYSRHNCITDNFRHVPYFPLFPVHADC